MARYAAERRECWSSALPFGGFEARGSTGSACLRSRRGSRRELGSWRYPGEALASQAGAVVFQLEGLRISRIGVRLDEERLARLFRPPPPVTPADPAR